MNLRPHPTPLERLRPGLAARLLLAVLALLTLLAGCGGERERPAPLAAPEATHADVAHCRADAEPSALVGHRLDGSQCRRAFLGLRRTAAAAGEGGAAATAAAGSLPRKITAAELMDWAEQQYASLFPSRRETQTLWPYVYRYYPETGNHLAVAGEQIYVQGPVSGGAILYVGTLGEYTCTAMPALCTGIRPCAVSPSWTVDTRTCTPNEGAPKILASGSTATFVDTAGATLGSITASCSDGTLTVRGTPQCEAAPPRACSTADLSWTAGSLSCTANPGEPTQLDAGGRHTFTASVGNTGRATYTCDNGLLLAAGSASCSAPAGTACSTTGASWTVGGRSCRPDNAPASVSDGAAIALYDVTGAETGLASFTCRQGQLQLDAGATCGDQQRVADSFGGDGGAADGGASGDGTAADGAPIVGGLVRVADLNGRTAVATTDSRGYFRVRLTGMTPPLLVTVLRPDGKLRRSLSLQAPRTNGYQFIAVTGLTDKLVSDLAAAAGYPGSGALTPAMLDKLRAQVPVLLEALRKNPLVRARVVAAGLDADRFDPLHTPFRPDGKGYDAVLDNLLVDTDDTGATVLRSADCTAPASWTVDGVTCTPDAGEETVVPAGTTIVHRDTVGSTRGGVGYSCSKGVLSRPLSPSCTASPN